MFLIVSSLVSFVLVVARQGTTRHEMQVFWQSWIATQNTGMVPPGNMQDAADRGFMAMVVVLGCFWVLVGFFGALTLRKPGKRLLVVDMVLTAVGLIGLVARVVGIPIQRAVAPSSSFSLVESTVSATLFLAMLVTLKVFGPWAVRAAPPAK